MGQQGTPKGLFLNKMFCGHVIVYLLKRDFYSKQTKSLKQSIVSSLMSGALVLVDFGRFLGEAFVPPQFFFPVCSTAHAALLTMAHFGFFII